MEHDKLLGDVQKSDCFGNERSSYEISKKRSECFYCFSLLFMIVWIACIPLFAIIAVNYAADGNIALTWTFSILSGICATPFVLGILCVIYIFIKEYLCVIIL